MRAKFTGSRSPTDTDRVVGSNVRALRISQDITLAELAADVGISHQQLQKYETGSNRISAGTLLHLATVLKVELTDFYRESNKSSDPNEDPIEQLRRDCVRRLSRVRSKDTLLAVAKVIKALDS